MLSLNAAPSHRSSRPHLSSAVPINIVYKTFPCAAPRPVSRARQQHKPQAATDLFSNLIATACIGTSLVLISRELLIGRATERTLSGEDNFKWGLMGFISCIPVFNWLAWVFAAVDADNPRPYLLLAGLYGSTLLTNGFDLDGFTWTMLALGALHVQVARITATEPQLQQQLKEGLQPASLLTTSAQAARKAAQVVVGPGPGAGGQQQQEGLPAAAGGSGRGKGKDALFSDEELQQEREMAEQQLREFDRLLQQKQGGQEPQELPSRAPQPGERPARRSRPEDDDDW